MRVGIVSIYPPPRSKHAELSGVASYSRNLVDHLLKSCSVVVFADKIGISNSEYSEGAIVHRCWSRGFKYPFQIFRKLLRSEVDVVHVQHELYLFGGLASTFLFPFLLVLVRLLGKPVIVTMHGVIPLSRVDRSFLEENRISGNPLVMKFGLALLVKISVPLSTAVVVHEETLRNVLIKEYKCRASKVRVIHHGIEEPKVLVAPDEAKKKLGVSSHKVILFFGYITGYKNLELLIDSAKFIKVPDWVMLIAGGAHPRLYNDPDYLNYLSDLREKASKISENILFKGFVPESEIPLYFSAADLVIFPYNVCISSSGPLALAASYRRPFLVSASFRDVVNSNEIVFRNDPRELADKIDLFFKDSAFSSRMAKYTEDFRNERLWTGISKETHQLYEEVVLK